MAKVTNAAARVRLFDQATRRQQRRQRRRGAQLRSRTSDRGWTREDLYDRGRAPR